MYTTCSTLATCTQGVVHTAGGTIEVRGEGEEANKRSVYMTRNSYTHKKPSGGVSSPNPRHAECLAGLTSGTSKNLDTPFVLEKFTPRK